jgi:hypothetical protein
VKRKNSIAAFGNQALTVPPFYRMPRSICRSISKISSDLGARFCGGSSSSLSTRETEASIRYVPHRAVTERMQDNAALRADQIAPGLPEVCFLDHGRDTFEPMH